MVASNFPPLKQFLFEEKHYLVNYRQSSMRLLGKQMGHSDIQEEVLLD
jgi:hypothetical protein